MLKIWNNKLIATDIIDTSVHYNCNSYKQESYTTNFCNSNFENDLDAVIAGTIIKGDYINFVWVYNNINNRR